MYVHLMAREVGLLASLYHATSQEFGLLFGEDSVLASPCPGTIMEVVLPFGEVIVLVGEVVVLVALYHGTITEVGLLVCPF